MQLPPSRFYLVALLLASGCSQLADSNQTPTPTDAVSVTIEAADISDVLLITDADGNWQRVEAPGAQYSFVPATAAYGVAFACAIGGESSYATWYSKTRLQTIDDDLPLVFDGCHGDIAYQALTVTAEGLEPNQELIRGYDARFTADDPESFLMFFEEKEFMGVLWQQSPRQVLGFVRQPLPGPGNQLTVNAANFVPAVSFDVSLENLASPFSAGLDSILTEDASYYVLTSDATDGTITVPDDAFFSSGELMAITVTSSTAEASGERIRRTINAPSPFTPTLPAPWRPSPPQFVTDGVQFSFTPKSDWNGTYVFELADAQNYAWEQSLAASAKWAEATKQTSIMLTDFSPYAPWFRRPKPSDALAWFSSANATTGTPNTAGFESATAYAYGGL